MLEFGLCSFFYIFINHNLTQLLKSLVKYHLILTIYRTMSGIISSYIYWNFCRCIGVQRETNIIRCEHVKMIKKVFQHATRVK